jgi:SAM-dependent methyltransferase
MRARRHHRARWELTEAEADRVRRSARRPLALDAAAALLRHPRALPEVLRSGWQGLWHGIRNDGSLLWLTELHRVRRTIPDAAPGVLWSAPGTFLDALEPYLGHDVRALEIGCGAGRVAVRVAPAVGELVAVDSSSAMLAEARRNLRSAPNVRLHRNRGYTLRDFDDGAFDLVFSHDVFRQLDGQQAFAFIDEARRVTRPGGHFVVSFDVIDAQEWAEGQLLALRTAARQGRFGPNHARPYAAGQVDAMLEIAGFQVVERRHDRSPTPYYVAVAEASGHRPETSRRSRLKAAPRPDSAIDGVDPQQAL